MLKIGRRTTTILGQGTALTAAAAAVACALLAALPNVELTNGAFKILVLTLLSSLSVTLLLRPDATDESRRPRCRRFPGSEASRSAIARDIYAASTRSHVIRVGLGDFRLANDDAPHVLMTGDTLRAVVQARPPNHCELRVVCSFNEPNEVRDMLVRLKAFGGAHGLYVRGYIKSSYNQAPTDTIITGDHAVYLGHMNEVTLAHDDGLRSTDRTLIDYLTSRFDDAWNNAPFSIFQSIYGVDHRSVEAMIKELS